MGRRLCEDGFLRLTESVRTVPSSTALSGVKLIAVTDGNLQKLTTAVSSGSVLRHRDALDQLRRRGADDLRIDCLVWRRHVAADALHIDPEQIARREDCAVAHADLVGGQLVIVMPRAKFVAVEALEQESLGLNGAPNTLAWRPTAATHARLSARRGDTEHSDQH